MMKGERSEENKIQTGLRSSFAKCTPAQKAGKNLSEKQYPTAIMPNFNDPAPNPKIEKC